MMMTEAKRYRKVLGLIEDNNGDLLDLTEIEERLNEQHETIQKQKQVIYVAEKIINNSTSMASIIEFRKAMEDLND